MKHISIYADGGWIPASYSAQLPLNNNMKSFVVICAFVAIAAAGETREKRGFLHGGSSISSYGGLSSGYSGLGGYSGGYSSYSAPAARVVSVNKLVNVNRVVEVPQVVSVRKVVSEPRLVTEKRIISQPSYSSGYDSGISSGYLSGYSSGHSAW